MTTNPIKTKTKYQQASLRLEKIFDAVPGTQEGDELEMLAWRIEEYEKKHYPLNEKGLSKKEIVKFLVFKNNFK